MKVVKLAWVGTRTQRAGETADFFQHVMGLDLMIESDDFYVLRLPDGSKVEVFGPSISDKAHFTTGPVVGFLVDDFDQAVSELRARNVEIVFGPQSSPDGNQWVHFRGPDGNLYELTADPGVNRPS